MKEVLTLAILIAFSALKGLSQDSQHVLYGERSKHFTAEEGVIRVFFDQHGDLYPSSFISDTALIANNASLREYYANKPQAFIDATVAYGLANSSYSDQRFTEFQAALQQILIDSINAFATQQQLFILIHGFRKPMTPRSWSTTSQRDYEFMRTSIMNTYGNRDDARFVEVYWDGMYDCCIGRKTRTNKRIFLLYEEIAQVNAATTGYALRKLLTPLERDEFTIITHSLGAQVGLSILTNTFDDRIDAELQSYTTPQQPKVNLFLVAPAISKEPFEEYHQRTTGLDFAQADNYHLSILYNKKDFVLKKRWKIFGPGPRKYGNTSLGCNCKNEIVKLEAYFNLQFPNSSLNLFKSKIGATHSARRYSFSDAFTTYIETLITD